MKTTAHCTESGHVAVHPGAPQLVIQKAMVTAIDHMTGLSLPASIAFS